MIGRISRFMTRFVSRWLPDPLIFAMLLTLLRKVRISGEILLG
ncbi:TIGR00366 family protein [Escherichia coli]